MKRYICIHGHFYQPPRENPWLDEIELQDSAYPYHDWNERINSECYAPNAVSRILDGKGRIIDLINNYEKMSFNIGPTLLSWLRDNDVFTYQAILEADRRSLERFSGHGSAIAQVYNHLIMPLANSRDKYTQVYWSIKDFEQHFKRKPEGMWLPETAVDTRTLEVLAEQGIKYTILAPRQAEAVRKLGAKEWEDVQEEKIDPKRSYACKLPGGKEISIFFYDGPISKAIAFEGVLKNGKYFSDRLNSAFDENGGENQLVNIATDGETYGHHHMYGEMALAYCLNDIESNGPAKITVYGEYLENNPPEYEVKIVENSSWSCVHGIERWRDNCGCNSGLHDNWAQGWRGPLREAMDWLSNELAIIFEAELANYFKDPWTARNEYIALVISGYSTETIDRYIKDNSSREIVSGEDVRVLKLLEMQRHAMLMYTSCGWFFDDLAGIETVQVMQHAARALQLAREITGKDLEGGYVDFLKKAPVNTKGYSDGSEVYSKLLKPHVLDIIRIGAHYAVYSLFKDYSERVSLYNYGVKSDYFELVEKGIQKLVLGKVILQSKSTREKETFVFAVSHMGGHNIIGRVGRFKGEREFMASVEAIKAAFTESDLTETIAVMDKYYEKENISMLHLFKAEQREVLSNIANHAIMEIDSSFRNIYNHNYSVMQAMNEMQIPLPLPFYNILEFIFNSDIKEALNSEDIDFDTLSRQADEVSKWEIEIDRVTLSYCADRALLRLMKTLSNSPMETGILKSILDFLGKVEALGLKLKPWQSQNIFFMIGRNVYNDNKANNHDSGKWVEYFNKLADYLKVRTNG